MIKKYLTWPPSQSNPDITLHYLSIHETLSGIGNDRYFCIPDSCDFEAPEPGCGASPFTIAITKQDLKMKCHQRADDGLIVLHSFRNHALRYPARSSEFLHSEPLSGPTTFNPRLSFMEFANERNQH
jgi:hypothetical protein